MSLPGDVVAAVAGVLGALALVLATVVLWVDAASEPPTWTAPVAAGFLGAAIGWLVTAAAYQGFSHGRRRGHSQQRSPQRHSQRPSASRGDSPSGAAGPAGGGDEPMPLIDTWALASALQDAEVDRATWFAGNGSRAWAEFERSGDDAALARAITQLQRGVL